MVIATASRFREDFKNDQCLSPLFEDILKVIYGNNNHKLSLGKSLYYALVLIFSR